MTRMEDWSDEQWQQYYDAIDNSKKDSRHNEPLKPEEKEDLKEYARDSYGWFSRARNKIKNQHVNQSDYNSNSNSVDDAINNTDWS